MKDLLSAQEAQLNREVFSELPGPRGIIVSSLCGSTNQRFAVICNSMKKTLGERIREQRILMQMTQEELAEELCVKKSTISMYENDKVDVKGSILIELSGVLHTSPNYLLGMEEYEEDLLEIITVY